MTAHACREYVLCCDARPRCRALIEGDSGESRAHVRKEAARRGWTVNVGEGPVALRRDFCPDHKPVSEDEGQHSGLIAEASGG